MTLRDLYGMMSEHTWQIPGRASANQALEVLDTQRVDLVVVDVNMPVIDGIQFIGILQRRHPKLKRAVLSEMAARKKTRREFGQRRSLLLSITRPRVINPFSPCSVVLQWTPREGFQGVLRKVGLQDIIRWNALPAIPPSANLQPACLAAFTLKMASSSALIPAISWASGRCTNCFLSGGSFELAQFRLQEKNPQRLTGNVADGGRPCEG